MTIDIKEGQMITCPNCGYIIGTLVAINGEFWLGIGGVDVAYLHGRCKICQKVFHFDASEKKLRGLIARCRKRVV